MILRATLLGTVAALAAMTPAWALDSAGGSETVVVTGRAADLTGIAASANQGAVNAFDLNLRPLLRPTSRVCLSPCQGR